MDSTLTVQFRAYVHGVPLELNKKYQNPFGKHSKSPVSVFMPVDRARIYRRQFQIKIPSHYHLIDFSDSATTE